MNEKLGKAAYLTIGTKNINASFQVYEKLGYHIESQGKAPVHWMEVSDNSLKIILVEGADEYIGLTYVTDDINRTIRQLKDVGLKPVQTAGEDDAPQQVIAQIRAGILVSINQAKEGLDFTSTNKTLIDIDYSSPDPSDFPNELCGIFGEFAMNISDMDQSIRFWESMGFQTGERFEEPYPWAIVSDGMFVIGLHQTTEFDKPALTYFAPDMSDKLKVLKDLGLDIEMMDDGHSGKLETPEGQRFFLFSLKV